MGEEIKRVASQAIPRPGLPLDKPQNPSGAWPKLFEFSVSDGATDYNRRAAWFC